MRGTHLCVIQTATHRVPLLQVQPDVHELLQHGQVALASGQVEGCVPLLQEGAGTVSFPGPGDLLEPPLISRTWEQVQRGEVTSPESQSKSMTSRSPER